MSGLAAIPYRDLATADRVREELVRAAGEGLAQLDDAVLLERTLDGAVEVLQSSLRSADHDHLEEALS